VRRSVLAHRRALAALCAALAVLVVVRGNTAPAPARVPVLVATHDIGGGQHLDGSDVRRVGYAPRNAPGPVPGKKRREPASAGDEPQRAIAMVRQRHHDSVQRRCSRWQLGNTIKGSGAAYHQIHEGR